MEGVPIYLFYYSFLFFFFVLTFLLPYKISNPKLKYIMKTLLMNAFVMLVPDSIHNRFGNTDS